MTRYPRGPSAVISSRIINLLRQAAGGIVTHREMYEALWGDDPDGGPDDPSVNVQVAISRLRRRGFPIKTHHTHGYSYRWTVWEL